MDEMVYVVFVRAKSVTVLYKAFKTSPNVERIIAEIRSSPTTPGLTQEQIDDSIANVLKGEYRVQNFVLVS